MAAGACLKQQGIEFIILDGQEQIGDTWRKRWGSLKLFTPADYNSLPSMPFPPPGDHLPTKDEVADYLVAYAVRFDLPVQLDVWVERLTRNGRSYRLHTSRGLYEANHVIVATGTYQKQRIPAFAADLDPAIEQIPSNRYRSPAQLPAGDVLVVGAGNSGAEIALDVAQAEHKVWLSDPQYGPHETHHSGQRYFLVAVADALQGEGGFLAGSAIAINATGPGARRCWMLERTI